MFNSKGQLVNKETSIFTQAAVGYVTLSPSQTEACANCVFYRSTGFDGIDWPHCHIVENYPDPIEPTGYCNEWRAKPVPPPDMTEAIVEAVEGIAETIMEAMPMMSVEMERKPLTFQQRIAKLFTRKKPMRAFEVVKSKDGSWVWHAIYSNNFEDLEGEILKESGFDNYIDRLDMGLIPMPVLQAWHTPGSEHGQADIVFRNGHFVHAVGHFFDSPLAAKAITYYRKHAGKLKMSHGFYAPEWAFDGKHYSDFNTIELTTLPPWAAANPYTSFEELSTMSPTPEKQKYLEELFGKEGAATILQSDEDHGKALEEMKIAFKDLAHVTPDEGEDEPADDGGDEGRKSLKVLYGDMATNIKELYDALLLQGKAIVAKDKQIEALTKKFDDETAAWQKELNTVRTIINQPPRRPSQDDSTVRKDSEQDLLKNAIPADDPKTGFWAGMGISVKTEGN